MSAAREQRLLYEQTGFPTLQNRTYATRAEARACTTGDIRLVEDLGSGLVYNAAFREELMTYDASYQNEQGTSRVFQEHLEAVSAIVERSLGRERLVEVGCGKGFFLEMLAARGFDVSGFDAAYEGDHPRISRRAFEPGVGIAARALILRHVLEHIADPVAFLRGLRQANGGQGRIYIEVPCFDWILDRRAWFDVFYEHVNYFRMSDFERMFGTIVESGRLFGGQYLYVVAELATLREPVYRAADAVEFPADFTRGLVAQSRAEQRPTAIWGGASKGVIFALLRERAGRPVDAVIDINPAKQGRHLPATGLLVESSAQALARLPKGATIFVMNSNYLDEIKRMSDNAFNYIEVDRD